MQGELEGPHSSDEERQEGIEGEDDEDTNISTLQFSENGVSTLHLVISCLNISFIDFDRPFVHTSYQQT